jgi:hypothetical protein
MSRFVLIAIFALGLGCSTAQAQGGRGTPEEQKACSRDASRFCRKQMSDGDDAVQECLQEHRGRLGRACLKVFESHGM